MNTYVDPTNKTSDNNQDLIHICDMSFADINEFILRLYINIFLTL